MPGLDEVSSNLARSLRQLRELRGWTQQQLSKLSGVPRPTVANLESGSANPTLSVLTRIASALQVTLDELISPPRASARRYPAAELPCTRRGAVEVRQLLPDAIPGVTVERMSFAPCSRLVGVPHTAGTREYLMCERGQLQLVASGETYLLQPGDVVVFRGDQRHSYQETDDAPAVAYSFVLP
ncbi:MAG TPA: XRE family transcriptional regulator [Deltaproteobacteria bacterium]|nr:XRE family transcriptional regulator [Deltaproteobacteria bacterium]